MFGITLVKESKINSLKSEFESLKTNFSEMEKKAERAMILEENLLNRGIYRWITPGAAIHYDTNDQTYIEKGYTYNPHIYTVISYICECLSQITFYDNKIVDKKAHAEYLRLKKEGKIDEANWMKVKSLERVEVGGLAEILKNPNKNQDWSQFMFESTGFFELTGNLYTYGLEYLGLPGVFGELYTMPSNIVQIVMGTWKDPVDGYKIRNTNNKFDEIAKEAVLHQKNWNPESAWNNLSPYGMSTLKALCRTMRRSNEGIDADLAMLLNGGPPGIVSNKSERPMKPEEVDKFEQKWIEKRGGGGNKNKVMFSATELSYQATGLDSVDLQILESDMADFATICRAYKIDEIVLNPDNATYNNKVQAEKSVWQNTLIPKLNARQRGLNRWLCPGWSKRDGYEHFIDYDTSNIACLQTDLEKMTDRQLKEFGIGLHSINDLLKSRGLPTDDNNPFMNMRFMENRFHELGKEPQNPNINPKP